MGGDRLFLGLGISIDKIANVGATRAPERARVVEMEGDHYKC